MMCRKHIGNQADFALLITRIVTGVIFLVHGIDKFQTGLDGVAGFFMNVGIPAPLFFAWVVTLIETIGGIALILGIFTEIFAILLGIILIVAIWRVKIMNGIVSSAGPAAELDLALLAGMAVLLLQGAGRKSLDFLMMKEKSV